MAHLLQRLGRASFRRRRLVLAVWLGLFAAVAGGALTADGSFTANFSIPGTESQKAIDLLNERVPATAGATGRVVIAAPKGERLTGQARADAQATLRKIARGPGVVSVSDPFKTGTVSKDGRIAYAQLTFKEPANGLTATERVPIVAAAEQASDDGLQVGITGDAAPQTESAGGGGEAVGIVIALVILLITFGAIVAAGMPLLTAVLGVGIGLTGIMAASAVFDLSSAVISLAAMLGLAVGIDYALFIISRYRTLAQNGLSPQEAAGQAVGTAGTAVVFAGSTVVIALAALVVTGVPFMAAMGIAAAATVAVAVLIAITLVPALLGFAGRRALKGKRSEPADETTSTMGSRWVTFVMRHRLAAIGLVVLATVALAIPATHLRLGLPDGSSSPVGSVTRTGSDLLSEGFGKGFNGQLTIVAELDEGTDGKSAGAAIVKRISALDDVADVAPAQLTPDGGLAIISVTPESGPSSVATQDLVERIRDEKPALTPGTNAELSVTGSTAVNIDVVSKMGTR
jgi:RND superfamily putative drug exporter